MKKNLFAVLIAVLLISSMIGLANATVLTSKINMDDGYNIYLSTTDSSVGSFFGSGHYWPTTHTHTIVLTQGLDYYLHVYGYDQAEMAGFLGEFSLSGSDHVFENNTTSLLTTTTYWNGNNIGWGNPYIPLSDFGANVNGTVPWGIYPNIPIADIPAAARWIWAGDNFDNNQAYFSTKISAVPEPATMLLLGTGFAGLAGIMKRRKRR